MAQVGPEEVPGILVSLYAPMDQQSTQNSIDGKLTGQFYDILIIRLFPYCPPFIHIFALKTVKICKCADDF
jgi:hypothetical protein